MYDVLDSRRWTIVASSLTVTSIRSQLELCGYQEPLLVADFPLGTSKGTEWVPVAAFAHEPSDAASACIAVLVSDEDPGFLVPRYRELGAPVYFVVHRQRLQWWSQGADRPQHIKTLRPAEVPHFFGERREELAPETIHRAKTRGRFENEYQLAFVDVGLMPVVEAEMGRKLSNLVERAVVEGRKSLAPRKMTSQLGTWLFRSVFWLLAAKILRDKRVPGFQDLDLADLEEVFSRVAQHYGAESRELGFALQAGNRRRALESAVAILVPFASLAHTTTESLAWVYENTLVSKETRVALGTHSTPSFLARYVVWRLAPWISEMPPARRNVFEPTCGQGTFLVAAMRLLRDLLPARMNRQQRKVYLRQQLNGLDIDSFAIELARLSLTLADVPNPDGWNLHTGNVFTDPQFPELLSNATILLANPPFESFKPQEREQLASQGVDVRPGSKAAELLRRTLPKLPAGAVFGVVLPQGLLHSRSATDVRSLLVRDFEIAEIAVLPDKIFAASDAESALLLGRRLRRAGTSRSCVRYVRVREPETERFRSSYGVSMERWLPQSRFATAPARNFFVSDLEEVWEECQGLRKLADIADIGKGLEYRSDLPAGTKTFSSERFPDAQRGFAHVDRNLKIHTQPQEVWMNLDSEVIRRPGTGLDTDIPQVLMNYARVSRGPWRLKATLDPQGHAVTSNFLTLRPRKNEISLYYLWALTNSPFSNAYIFSHSTKRHILKKTMLSLPVPRASSSDIDRVNTAVQAYLTATMEKADAVLQAQLAPSRARDLMLSVDAEVMRLYDLPPLLERQTLDLFAGWNRLGVHFDFDRYFPPQFEPWIPLHVYLSEGYRQSTAGKLRSRKSPAPRVVLRSLEAATEAFEDRRP